MEQTDFANRVSLPAIANDSVTGMLAIDRPFKDGASTTSDERSKREFWEDGTGPREFQQPIESSQDKSDGRRGKRQSCLRPPAQAHTIAKQLWVAGIIIAPLAVEAGALGGWAAKWKDGRKARRKAMREFNSDADGSSDEGNGDLETEGDRIRADDIPPENLNDDDHPRSPDVEAATDDDRGEDGWRVVDS